jgi:hypothetical protein
VINYELHGDPKEDPCNSFIGIDRAHFDSFNRLGVCGCGNPEEVLAVYHRLMWRLAEKRFDGRLAEVTDGHELWLDTMLYTLDAFGLTEHGTSVGGSWLSEDGERCLEVLDVLELFGYEPTPVTAASPTVT